MPPAGKTLSIYFGTAIAVLLASSCTNITEYELIYSAGLNVISPEDFSVVASFPEVKSARCMMPHQGLMYVVSSEGFIYSYDLDSLTLIDQHQIGPPTPSGYNKMIFCPWDNSAYLIGALGYILQLSLPDCEVIDQFSVCASPVDLAITSGTPGYLWVVDGQANSIDQVLPITNVSCHTVNIPDHYRIQCIEPSSFYPDSLLVGTSDGICRIEVLSAGNVRLTWAADLFTSWQSLCSIPYDSNFVAIKGGNAHQVGELCVYDLGTYIIPPPKFYNVDMIDGESFLTAAANDGMHVYALSYVGDGTSRLVSYRYSDPPYGIDREADFQGYPLDLKVSDTGMIYVLTYQ